MDNDIQYFSQWGEDRWIMANLRLPVHGTFVEVGAHDGISGSNTLAFERIGWTGVVIEPDPRSFEMLKRNRRCQVLPYAIGTDSTAVFHLEDVAPLSGFLRSGTPVKLLNRTLGEALDEVGIGRIDLLSIDTEGTELDVWASFDPSKFRPGIVIIEWNTLGMADRSNDIRLELRKYGYTEVKKSEANIIFTATGQER